MSGDNAKLAAIFARKYEGEDGDWGGGSGPGSDPYYNLPYRAFLEHFIRLNSIGSIVDIGCGDWQFSRYLDLRGIDYVGYDLVQSVVERNRRSFGSATVRFETMPADLTDLPGAHLLIMKDVLQHLTIADICRFRDEVFPKSNYCLITNSFEKIGHDGAMMGRNGEIAAGDFRCLDLRAAPFHVAGVYVLGFPIGVREQLRTLLVQRA